MVWRHHRELILNYFRAKKQFCAGVVEGLNDTQYVIDHYGNMTVLSNTLDGAIRSGVRISYADPHVGLNDVGQTILGGAARDFRAPIEDWEID